jgi:hypothetical protein
MGLAVITAIAVTSASAIAKSTSSTALLAAGGTDQTSTAAAAAGVTKFDLVQFTGTADTYSTASTLEVVAVFKVSSAMKNIGSTNALKTVTPTVEFTVNQAARAAPAMMSQKNNAAASATQHQQSLLSTAAQATLSHAVASTKVHDSGLHDTMVVQNSVLIASVASKKSPSALDGG